MLGKVLFKTIIEDLNLPYELDPAIRTKWEILFNYPGVWAVIWYRLSHKLHLMGLKLIARFISGFAQILTSVDIHPGAHIGRRVFIDHGTGVVIGETAIIGNDVTIYQGVTLGGVTLEKKKRHPTLEDGVVVGGGAKVLGDITIGKNARIGANSVVVKDVPAEATAVGIPAKVITKDSCNVDKKKDKLSHDDLPDIHKELFLYVIKRLKILENSLTDASCIKSDLKEEDRKLEEFYHRYIDTIDKEKS